MTLIFGRRFIAEHQENTTWSGSGATSEAICTDSPWHKGGVSMYVADRYARDRVMKAARLLLPYLKDNDLVLDVGCFTQEAKKYFPPWVKYLGIDQTSFHVATKITNLHHGFSPIPCQAALCLETLEHLLDPADTLKAIHDSLIADGHCVISLPNEITAFHRVRCLFGTADAQAFSGQSKHLHLPSLKQSQVFLANYFLILSKNYYISPNAFASKQAWVGKILSLIPDTMHQFLADCLPSLFARGFIFLLKKKPIPDSTSRQLQEQSLPS